MNMFYQLSVQRCARYVPHWRAGGEACGTTRREQMVRVRRYMKPSYTCSGPLSEALVLAHRSEECVHQHFSDAITGGGDLAGQVNLLVQRSYTPTCVVGAIVRLAA
eukprot:CAMPEP_0119119518 /NCGR_PEP_ID=MMETSP1310-20130426/976_1 /TAXON_ID=464262 /ORGANISM="Genus nov. species nov., Strain RCC2339" /LENGTH=105 /DNA_ID=CAMNT_0007108959 /DNA_START=94 /DNA_END=407 /DNA_ORIENTATION=+